LFFLAWDQSDKFVKIYLTGLEGASELPKENLVAQFTPTSVSVKVLNLKGKNHCFTIKETGEKIDVDKSYTKAKTGESHSLQTCL